MSTPGDEVPRGVRRRRANVLGGRQHRHEVRVSPEEEALLLQKAAAAGVTVPRLLIESALTLEGGETVSERREGLAQLFTVTRLLSRTAVNINQMAKATNATGEVQHELSATLQLLRKTTQRINGLIEEMSLR